MSEKEITLGARFDDKTIARIDRHRERLEEPGTRPTRSDALRNIVERGLDEIERRQRKVGVTRGETGASAPKTKREA